MLEKTLARIGYAMITASTPSSVTYGPVNWLDSTKAGGREISSEPQGELQEEHADGIIVFSSDINGGYKHNLTLLSVLDSVDKDWLNKVELEDGSIAEFADGNPAPRFALLVAKETIDGDNIYNVETYYNTTASRYTKNSKSHKPGDPIDFEFPQYSLTSRPSEVNKLVYTKKGYDQLPATVTLPSRPAADDNSDNNDNNE